jgi:periplasmic mercuric ion binding protein
MEVVMQRVNKAITGILLATVVVLLVVLAFHVKPAATADSVAVLKTSGMTCGSCASKINNALGMMNGVTVTEVDVDGGWVMVGYEKKSVRPETLVERVNKAGFASTVQAVLTPEQFKQITGHVIGQSMTSSSGCCGRADCGGK